MITQTIRYAALALVVGALSQTSWMPSVAAQAPEVIRTVLLRQDLPMPNYEAVEIAVELPVGAREGRHTHAGVLIVHMLEGTMTYDHEGKERAEYGPGATFSAEPGKIHEGINNGDVTIKAIATLIAPKDQDLTTQVP
jgi:quercetin dioxygenase-like cupin family protein